jgi:hypothetical protein
MSTAQVVEAPKTRLVDELKAAETAVRSAEIQLGTIEKNIESGRRSIPEQERNLEKAPPAYQSDGGRLALRRAKSWLAGEEAKLSDAKSAVAEARRSVTFVRSKIDRDPLYSAALAKRREFTQRGVELARRAWSATIPQVRDLVRQYEVIADDEQNFVLRENSKLAVAGLPELRAVLANYHHALPEMIAKFDVEVLGSEAAKLIAEMEMR